MMGTQAFNQKIAVQLNEGTGLNFEHFQISACWEDPEARSRIVSVIKNGILKHEPDAANLMLCKLAVLSRQSLTDTQIMQELNKGFRDRNLDAGKNESFSNDEVARVERRVEQITRLFPPGFKPESFIDLGCGDGKITSGLAKAWDCEKGRAFGADVFSRAGDTKDITYLNINENQIPLRDKSCDVAMMFMTLHHESDPVAILEETHRVLKDGGLLIVRDHDAGSLSDKLFCHTLDKLYYNVFNNFKDIPVPGNYKSAEEWENIAESVGFEVLRSWSPEPQNPNKPFHMILKT